MTEPSCAANLAPSSKRRIHGILILLLAFVIAAGAVVADIALLRVAEQGRRAELLLLQVQGLAYRLSALEWQAIGERQVSAEMARGVRDTQDELDRAVGSLEQLDPDVDAVRLIRRSHDGYRLAINNEFSLLKAGDFAQAKIVDRDQVDPAFEALGEVLRVASATYSTKMKRAERLAALGSLAVLLLAMAAIAALVWRTQKAQTAAEEAGSREQLLALAQRELSQHRNHLEQLVFSRTEELALAKDAAEAANRAKSVFLANMSHELHTPINGIMGMTDLALRRATDPQQIDWLHKSKACALRLLGIIDNILDIARIEAGRVTPEAKDFSLSQVIDDALRGLSGPAREKGLSLSATIDPALPDLLCGDAQRLEQVLTNFISNAVKFSERGQIAVRAGAVEQDSYSVVLRVEVSDQGIGIISEEQARLFQAFAQADDSFTRRHGGTGLGLIIAKRLAMLMGGEVGADSTPGVGSTFWFTARLRRGRGNLPADKTGYRDGALTDEPDAQNAAEKLG